MSDSPDKGLESAAAQARRAIHDNDVEGLKRLLTEHPRLLSWRGDDGEDGLLGIATGSYGDSFDPVSEQHFTRAECAELLIDTGAVVMPSVREGLLRSRARGLLQLFQRKGLLPHTLEFLAAFGDIDAVRAALQEHGDDLAAVNEAFTVACAFKHDAAAALLLDRSIALDPELGARVDGRVGRQAFIRYFIENRPRHGTTVGPWRAFVMERVSRAAYSYSGHETSVVNPTGSSDLAEFVRLLRTESWLLDEALWSFKRQSSGGQRCTAARM